MRRTRSLLVADDIVDTGVYVSAPESPIRDSSVSKPGHEMIWSSGGALFVADVDECAVILCSLGSFQTQISFYLCNDKKTIPKLSLSLVRVQAQRP